MQECHDQICANIFYPLRADIVEFEKSKLSIERRYKVMVTISTNKKIPKVVTAKVDT